MDANPLFTTIRTLAAWALALLLFFPLGWLFLTSFKTELQAIAVPPLFTFTPTMENFGEVQERSNYLLFARNSLITSVLSTLIGLAIAAPAAYSMAFFRTRWSRDILMWMLSTKMMPAVGALIPIYVLAQDCALACVRVRARVCAHTGVPARDDAHAWVRALAYVCAVEGIGCRVCGCVCASERERG